MKKEQQPLNHFTLPAAGSRTEALQCYLHGYRPELQDEERLCEKERKRSSKRKIPAEAIYDYHGTNSNVIESILQDNFDLSKAARHAHGRGNYFSGFPETAGLR